MTDIEEGEEITYDYGVRSEEWMKAGYQEARREESALDTEADETSVAITPAEDKEKRKGGYKRNYFWCPVKDCASGPVQKVTQHLHKVHGMDPVTASKVARKKEEGTRRGHQAEDTKPKDEIDRVAAHRSLLQARRSAHGNRHRSIHQRCCDILRGTFTCTSTSCHPEHVHSQSFS